MPQLAGTLIDGAPVVALEDSGVFPRGTVESSPHGPERTGSPRSGVLLDRDGTIIVDHGYIGSARPGRTHRRRRRGDRRLNRAGVPVAVVTNQAGVARGLYDISDVEEVHRYIAELLAEHGAHIDRFFYCPYHPDGTVAEFARTSNDRKPMPGMAGAAAEALNLDLTPRGWSGTVRRTSDWPKQWGRPPSTSAPVPAIARRVVVPEPRLTPHHSSSNG